MTTEPDIVHANLREMATALSRTGDADLIEEFLKSLLTESEIDEVAKRWALVKDLATGTPQRAIAARLGLSLCKITRGSRELQRDNSPFRQLLVIAGYKLPERIVMKRGPRAKVNEAACED